MFEKTRKDLVERLGDLMDRFDALTKWADEWIDKSQLAQRRGLGALGADDLQPLLYEIAVKAREQGELCAESITLLLRDRALPLMFKRAVRKAEAFAAQCEAVLDDFDGAEAAGKQAFRERLGE